MATKRYPVEFDLTTSPATGLSPSWVMFKKLSDLTDIAAPSRPIIYEIGYGTYFFDYDPSESIIAIADAGSDAVLGRYRRMVISPNDNKVVVSETPSGAYDISLTTKDGNGVAIPGVLVAIVNGSGSTVRTAVTTADGSVDPSAGLRLDAGTYTIKSFRAMASFADIEITISSDTMINLIGETISPTQPSGAFQTAYLVLASDDINAKLIAVPNIPEQIVSGTIFSGKKAIGVYNNGRIELQLVKGGKYTVQGKSESGIFYNEAITVTDDNVKDLLTYRSA